jgi:hypothetical protein
MKLAKCRAPVANRTDHRLTPRIKCERAIGTDLDADPDGTIPTTLNRRDAVYFYVKATIPGRDIDKNSCWKVVREEAFVDLVHLGNMFTSVT